VIQTLPCPSCHRVLVLNVHTSLQAVLRCRHCSHQFVLGEMLESELGFWEVVDDPIAPEPKVERVGEAASDSEEIELAKEEYISPQKLLNTQAKQKKTDWSKFEPITHEQYERMRRKGKSPIWSMLSVLLGGLASIPIATLLIWHVLGKDPLQMGPVVARVAPWIVPARFRPNNYAEETRPLPPPAGASGLPRVQGASDAQLTSGSPSASSPSNGGVPSHNPSPDRPQLQRRAPRAFPSPSNSSDLVDDTGLTERPQFNETTPNDVFTAIHLVDKDLNAWNERGEDRELQKKLALQTYSNLAALALAINQLPSPSPIRRLVRKEMNSIGQRVDEHPDIQQLIQSGSRYWLANHSEDLLGLAIVVNAASASESDSVWQFSPATAIGEETVQITVPKDILPALAEGQKLVAIGCLRREKPPVDPVSSEATSKSMSSFMASYVYVLKP
jgi:hypothetical protein